MRQCSTCRISAGWQFDWTALYCARCRATRRCQHWPKRASGLEPWPGMLFRNLSTGVVRGRRVKTVFNGHHRVRPASQSGAIEGLWPAIRPAVWTRLGQRKRAGPVNIGAQSDELPLHPAWPRPAGRAFADSGDYSRGPGAILSFRPDLELWLKPEPLRQEETRSA